MNAVNYKIRPFCDRICRITRMQSEMGSVGLIHNQWNPVTVYQLRDFFYIGGNSLIGGRRNHHPRDKPPRVFCPCIFLYKNIPDRPFRLPDAHRTRKKMSVQFVRIKIT